MSEPETTAAGVAFDCVDCGYRVNWFGIDRIPADRRCATCHWLVEFVPAGEREVVRRYIRRPPQDNSLTRVGTPVGAPIC